MDNNLHRLMQQFEKQISNNLLLMKFRFMNVCVKAEPAALIGVSVSEAEVTGNLEDVVDVYGGDEKTLNLVPHDGVDITSVAADISEIHPEFIVDYGVYKKSQDNEDTVTVLSLTVPDVDKDRRDILLKAVNTYKDAFNTYVDTAASVTKVKMAMYLADATDADKDKVTEFFKDKAKEYKDKAEQAAADKTKEIEDAYKRYLEEQAERQTEAEKTNLAEGADVAKTFIGK